MDTRETQTWVIFYLLSFIVLLLALFFTTQGILLGVGLTLIIIVIGINFYLMWNEINRFNRKRELMHQLSIKEIKEEEKDDFLM
ncbi:MAG: hypothetical protein JXQ82_01960 [Methanomicrobiaceae archaeon]|nr:hypothetical protein [Methanomicrobiaceae archaeon]